MRIKSSIFFKKIFKSLIISLIIGLSISSKSYAVSTPVKTYDGVWLATTKYAKGALVTYNNQIFLSLIDLNKGKIPARQKTAWRLLEQGLKGDTGLTGTQGLKGDTGLIGTQGLKGDTGLTGTQGLKGDTGLTGQKGLDALYKPPVVLDADGLFIGSFLDNVLTAEGRTSFPNLGIPSWIASILTDSDYIFFVAREGGISSYPTNSDFDGYETSDCSGYATLVTATSQSDGHPMKGTIFTHSKVIASPSPHWITSTAYYFPFNSPRYIGDVYSLIYLGGGQPSSCLKNYRLPGIFYYKTIPNDPSITHFYETDFNNLRAPFRITTNY